MTIKTQVRRNDQRKPEPACLNIALVGGNSAGKALIKFLETHSLRHFHVRIVGVADLREEAPQRTTK